MKTFFRNVKFSPVFVLVALLFAGPAVAVNNILGVWSCKQTLHTVGGDVQDYFTETFNLDGTDLLSNLALNSQSLPGSPEGLYGTVIQGRFAYIGANKVKRIATFLVNGKLPAFSVGSVSVPDYVAGTPVARALVNCRYTFTGPNSMNVTGQVDFYNVDDLDFDGNPAVPGIPSIPFDGVCERLTF